MFDLNEFLKFLTDPLNLYLAILTFATLLLYYIVAVTIVFGLVLFLKKRPIRSSVQLPERFVSFTNDEEAKSAAVEPPKAQAR